MSKFKVISSNPNEKGGFVTKIHREIKQETPFGTKVKNETLYVSGTKQLTENTDVDIDLDQFRVESYPFTVEETGEVMDLKWLHLR